MRALVVVHDSRQNVAACMLLFDNGDPPSAGALLGRTVRGANTDDAKQLFSIIKDRFPDSKTSPSAYDVLLGYSWEYHVSPVDCSIKNMLESKQTVYSGDVRGFIGYCESTL